MSKDTAQNFMKVFEKFGKSDKLPDFKPSVLYLLSAPSTPEEVVEKDVEKKITYFQVQKNSVK